MADVNVNLFGVDAAVGTVGSMLAGGSARVALALPRFWPMIGGGLGVTADVALKLPMPQLTLTIQGRTGPLVVVAGTLPTPRLAAVGSTGVVGTVALTLPTPVLQAQAPDMASGLRLPVPQLVVTGATGVQGGVILTLPAPVLSAGGIALASGGVVAQLPLPTIQIVGNTGDAIRMANTLRAFALAAQGYTGVVGEVALRLPIVRLDVEGYQPVIGYAQMVLPHLQLQATGRTASAPVADRSTITMHTETLSLTTYENYPFNSFAKLNGVFLGASEDGIFALSGPDDAGAPIEGYARVGISDFATSFLKRIDRIYIGYRSQGNMIVRIYTDETVMRDYLLDPTRERGLHGDHVRLGKGLLARYYQFEVRNMDGADFDLDCIELKPIKLQRRVGGRNA